MQTRAEVYRYLYLSINRNLISHALTRMRISQSSNSIVLLIITISSEYFVLLLREIRDKVGSQHIGYVCNGIGAFIVIIVINYRHRIFVAR